MWIILISFNIGCAVKKKYSNPPEQFLLKNIGNLYVKIIARQKADSIFLLFYDSLKTQINADSINGFLNVKYKSGYNENYFLQAKNRNILYAIVYDWMRYDICELNVFYRGNKYLLKFLNEREEWNKKEPLIAPWRGQF